MWAATGLSVRWWPIVAVEGKRNKEVILSVGKQLNSQSHAEEIRVSSPTSWVLGYAIEEPFGGVYHHLKTHEWESLNSSNSSP